MKTQYISGAILALGLLSFFPVSAQAYFTTHQTAAKITENAAVFTIEYAFGLDDHDVYMPVLAVRNLSTENDPARVGYTIREDSKTVITEGTSAGIVLSNAPIVNGMYKLEKGKAHIMTLFVIYKTTAESLEMDYALQVDALPYSVDKGEDELQRLKLNPSELQYYVTKEVELNSLNKN